MDEIQVPVATLRRAADILFERLEALEGQVVHLDADYFWAIPAPQQYDVYKEPSELTIGQLSECLENVSSIVDDPTIATSYGLVWLAELARAIGQTVVR